MRHLALAIKQNMTDDLIGYSLIHKRASCQSYRHHKSLRAIMPSAQSIQATCCHMAAL